MLALLSDDNKVFVVYLGTEPALFRMPVTQSRFIDFEARRKELREFEEIIWKHNKEDHRKIYIDRYSYIRHSLFIIYPRNVSDGYIK